MLRWLGNKMRFIIGFITGLIAFVVFCMGYVFVKADDKDLNTFLKKTCLTNKKDS